MTDRAAEPATVQKTANTPGTIRARWGWVDAAIWTERMLTALENGVQGSKWYSLMDKVASRTTLEGAWEQVQAHQGAAGVDHVTVEVFEQHLEENLDKLTDGLRAGRYRPQGIRRVWIPKPGSREQRPLGVPTVRDRVVQTALVKVLEPIFERDFAEHSYGFRPKRGCKDALRRVDELLKQGYQWIVDADLKSYFDTIPHGKGDGKGGVEDSRWSGAGGGRELSASQGDGDGGRMDPGTGNAARGGPESPAFQLISRSAGSCDGGGGT